MNNIKDIKGTNRITWIDTARCLAIILVVLCHATEGIYSINLNFMNTLSTQSRIFGFSSFSLGRIGVPLFLFITGYLLLDRDYTSKGSWISFWKKNLLWLLLTSEIWIVLDNVFLALFNGTPFSWIDLICNMLFLKNVNMSQMWYIPMILGVYLFIPLLSNCLRMMDRKLLYILMAVIFVYTCIVPLLSGLYEVTMGGSLSTGVNTQFLGGYYGLYLILGWMVKKDTFQKCNVAGLSISGILMFVVVVMVQLAFYANGYQYNVWYSCAFLLICGLCVFLLISKTPSLPFQKCINDIARKSFGIYFIHIPIRMLFLRITGLKETSVMMPIKVVVLFLAIFLISWGAVTLLCKIPKIGKTIAGVK